MIRVLLTTLCFFFLAAEAHADVKDVWIDADPACGLGQRDDVDDCWAIVAALRSKRLNVVGISTVFGNAELDRTTKVARDIIRVITHHEPDLAGPAVYPGSSGPLPDSDLDLRAVSGLETALVERKLTILALGPLTNIARLLKTRPDLASRIETIVMVAGQRAHERFKVGTVPLLHFHDLNVRKDPDAIAEVLRSSVPLHLVPFEASRMARVTSTDLEWLAEGSALDQWLAARSKGWLNFWRHTLGAEAFAPFDTVAVLYLLRPDLLKCQRHSAELIRRRGMFTVRDTLEVTRSSDNRRSIIYCTDLNPPARTIIASFVRAPDIEPSALVQRHGQ